MWKRSLMGIVVLAVLFGLVVINTSPSFPSGVYLKTYQAMHKGDLVLLCPPDWPVFRKALERRYLGPGLCSGGFGYLIKRIVAEHGDRVCFARNGVTVNGVRLPNSAPIDPELHPQDGTCTLAEREILLMSEHPRSFDARYFGILSTDRIVTTVQPLWLLEDQ